jgi:hypothetical protein
LQKVLFKTAKTQKAETKKLAKTRERPKVCFSKKCGNVEEGSVGLKKI